MSYKDLKITSSNGMICATGNIEIICTLSKLDFAKTGTVRDGDGKLTGIPFVYFPPSRVAIMALESLCIPTSVSEEYIVMRNETMCIPISNETNDNNTLLRRPMMRHQLEFVEFAKDKRGSYNGGEQGTGKTMAACYLVDVWTAHINIVVCPSSLMLQWKTEFEMLYCDGYSDVEFNIIVLNEKSISERIKTLENSIITDRQNIIITNYESLSKLQPHLQALLPLSPYRNSNEEPQAVIIADEAWKIKNPKAKASLAARNLSYYCNKVLALSGTPICQGVSDLWAQLDFITTHQDDRMESIELFCARYEVPSFTYLGSRKIPKPGPCSDPIGLMERLGECFYRATKATSLDLPEKFPTERVFLRFPEATQRIYNAIARDGIAAIDPLNLGTQAITAIRLQQICGGWIVNTGSEEQRTMMELDEDHADVLSMLPIESPKAAWIEDFINDVLLPNPQMRCIVWFKFNKELFDVYERAMRLLGLGKVVKIHGEDKYTAEELEKVKESFNSKDPDGVQLICGQISKLAYGHNLQGGDINIYYSHTHRYVLKAQSADRTHRMGRVGGVRYVELCVAGTVDEDILAATDMLQDFNARLAPDTTSQVEEL